MLPILLQTTPQIADWIVELTKPLGGLVRASYPSYFLIAPALAHIYEALVNLVAINLYSFNLVAINS